MADVQCNKLTSPGIRKSNQIKITRFHFILIKSQVFKRAQFLKVGTNVVKQDLSCFEDVRIDWFWRFPSPHK